MNTAAAPSAAEWESMRQALWEPLRRVARVEDTVLFNDTKRWLVALPAGLRPRELPARFPRIANELARLWNDRLALDAYFDDLLVDKRSGRQGFPPLVREELVALFDQLDRLQGEAAGAASAA